MSKWCGCIRGGRARQGTHRRPPLGGRKPGSGPGRSRVPLHVQHPEKYTCYILDEPLLVGGGDKASGISSQAEQEKVSMLWAMHLAMLTAGK